MIPTGSILIRLGEYKGMTIRIYQKGSKIYVSEAKKHRESVCDHWELDNLPERLKLWVMHELNSRDTVLVGDLHKNFWVR